MATSLYADKSRAASIASYKADMSGTAEDHRAASRAHAEAGFHAPDDATAEMHASTAKGHATTAKSGGSKPMGSAAKGEGADSWDKKGGARGVGGNGKSAYEQMHEEKKASKLAAFRDKDKKPEHQLQQGAKGGQYYISESGKKIYVGKR
jgi:hypothetical protein